VKCKRTRAGALESLGPTDSFVGVPPLVVDPVSRQTNANGSFIASNGNPVPQAGRFTMARISIVVPQTVSKPYSPDTRNRHAAVAVSG